MMAKLELALAAVLGAALLLQLPAASAADKREPPSCSAIAFRPIPPGSSDGVQDAGLYHSRFVRIEVKASVKGGQPDYFVEINGKKPTSVAARDLPKDVAACAKLKRMSAPGAAAVPCTGDRLTVLTSHSGDERYYLLYGHEGKGPDGWRFCSAGTA
jgi:hypothetical protein